MVGKFDHITPTLRNLHWLLGAYRIKFKVCVLTFNALHGRGPSYLSNMISVRDVPYGLRSAESPYLDIPATKRKTLGDRAFQSAPKLWNSLPSDLRTISEVTSFKTKLKSHFFKQPYG